MARHAYITQNNKVTISLQYIQNEVSDEIDFLHMDKHESSLFLLMGMTKHSQSTQINKFAISLQYLKKEVREGVNFLHLDKHQSFYKLALFWRKWPGISNVPKIGS